MLCEKLSLRDGAWREIDFSVFDCIYHVAGIAHANTGKLSAAAAAQYYAVNRDLAVEVAQRAKSAGVKQFIHMSSMIVYGKAGHGRVMPDTLPAPDSVYGDSKWQGEQGVAALAAADFAVAVIRAPMIYGPDCKGNYRTLSALARKCPLFPAVKNERSMLYIGNLCVFVQQLIESGDAGVFFPQNKGYVNTSELVSCIAGVNNKKLVLARWAVPFAALAMRAPGKIGNLACKAFGDQTYDLSMSRYEGMDYWRYDFETSVRLTEAKGK